MRESMAQAAYRWVRFKVPPPRRRRGQRGDRAREAQLTVRQPDAIVLDAGAGAPASGLRRAWCYVMGARPTYARPFPDPRRVARTPRTGRSDGALRAVAGGVPQIQRHA